MEKVIVFIRSFGLMRLDTYNIVKKLGYKIAIAADKDFNDKNNALGDYVIYTDTSNVDKLITDISNFGMSHKVEAVLTFLEQCIEQAATVAQILGCKGPSLESIKICRNKFLTRIKTIQKGIPTPGFFIAKSIEEIKEKVNVIKFPIIIKPLNFAGACAVIKVDCKEELDLKYQALLLRRENAAIKGSMADTTEEYWLVEEYIDGFEISVEAYAYQGQTVVVTIHDKILPVEAPDFIEGMSATPSPRITDELKGRIEQLTQEVFNSIGFRNGVAHVEYRISNNEPLLLEVNGRPGGGFVAESVFYSTGVQLNEVLIKICLGIDPSIHIENVKPTVLNELCPPEGKIVDIIGVNELKENKNLVIVEQRVKPGDIIKTSSMQLGILILAVGDNVEYLIELVKDLSCKVKFIVE